MYDTDCATLNKIVVWNYLLSVDMMHPLINFVYKLMYIFSSIFDNC